MGVKKVKEMSKDEVKSQVGSYYKADPEKVLADSIKKGDKAKEKVKADAEKAEAKEEKDSK